MKKYIASYFKFAGVLIISLALFASSCKKDKNEDTPQPTKKELLSNSWKIENIQSPDGISIIGLNFPEIACFKDNIFTMKADDSYIIDEKDVVCDDSYASEGTWSLIENETKIKFTPSSGDDPLIIILISVDSTTLKASYEFADAPLPGLYTITLKKI